ncbi:uncharacterized protein KD926_005914 [Aspergillus affinis]|uniref:uncharacterized protein n=1 Tax=Aspergillus affinis TaxID=1070780 RepID=UPI0022FE8BC9|nr:uncharacterized protein KD926_005914 [Aspergillus affinis]KAI9045970.1 hypothetical protein KD926_005914 [Aspergillus affinis]
MFKPRTTPEWLFCGALIIQAATVLILEIFTLSQWASWVQPNIIQVTTSYITPLNLGILLFACVCLFVLGIDAVAHKNAILLLAICASNSCGLGYSIMQYKHIRTAIHDLPLTHDGQNRPFVDLGRDIWPQVRPAQLAAPAIIGFCTLLVWPLAYQLHRQFVWELYRSIRGDTKTKVRYRAYELLPSAQVYIVLLKVDFYFIIGFILQYNLIDVHFDEPEYSLTMALIPATLIVMFSGLYFVRSERKIAMICVTVCAILSTRLFVKLSNKHPSPLQICYFAMIAYLLSRIIVLFGNGLCANSDGKDMMLLFAFMSLILTTLMVQSVIRCILNFGQGLKNVLKPNNLSDRESYRPRPLPEHPSSPVHSLHSRMSID